MASQTELRLGPVGVVEGYPAFPRKPIERIRWAMNAPIAHTSDKSVLMILAVHADERGKAWPSMATIARCGSMTRRTAFTAVRRLDETGWLAIDRRPRRPSRYWPKSPRDKHCPGCWYIVPSGAQICPICGLEGGEMISLGGEIISPNILMIS